MASIKINVSLPQCELRVVSGSLKAVDNSEPVRLKLEQSTVKIVKPSPETSLAVLRVGVPGPAGPQGPVGPPGPTGPEGPPGDAGLIVNKTLSYDAQGRLETITFANGWTKTLAYDGGGDLTSVVFVQGSLTTTTTLNYTAGQLTSVTYAQTTT